jgi:hypothetical protein
MTRSESGGTAERELAEQVQAMLVEARELAPRIARLSPKVLAAWRATLDATRAADDDEVSRIMADVGLSELLGLFQAMFEAIGATTQTDWTSVG